jgi:RND family efflux transporter MFP subunit
MQPALVVLVSVATLVLAGCNHKSAAPTTPPVITGLDVTQVQMEQISSSVDATGTVHAAESAVLAAQVMGRVISIAVHEGDSVRSGQTLVALDSAQAHADVIRTRATVASSEHEVQAAESEASLASSTLKRYELLREHKSVSPQEFDEVERRSQAAAARLDAARSQMLAAKASEAGAGTVEDYSRLRAPFSGFVTARHVDSGAMAMPGMPLLELEKSGTLQLNATVDESLIQTLKKSMLVPVVISAISAQPLSGHIADIVPAADPASHSFLIKIDLPATAGLRSGMFGTASISNGSLSALLVPQSALVTHSSLNGVWVLDGNHVVSLRYITLGAKHGDKVEVLSGLSAGEPVVLSPGDRELGGSKIAVRP